MLINTSPRSLLQLLEQGEVLTRLKLAVMLQFSTGGFRVLFDLPTPVTHQALPTFTVSLGEHTLVA